MQRFPCIIGRAQLPPQVSSRGRRVFLQGLAGLAFIESCRLLPVHAPAGVPRIGFLAVNGGQNLDVLKDALADLGYVDGRTIVIEQRLASSGTEAGLLEQARSLVNLPADVIVTVNTPAAQAAKRATTTVPIVAVGVTTPIETGLVASLAKPGGNLTALALSAPGLYAKWVDLLRQVVPRLARVGVIVDSTNLGNLAGWEEVRTAAERAGIVALRFDVQTVEDLGSVLKRAAESDADAGIDMASTLMSRAPLALLNIVLTHPKPTITILRAFVVSGILMSYGPNTLMLYRRAAVFVDKILKGANPAEIPVEQPSVFDFTVNTRALRNLGLTIPASLLPFVTEWIE
jgi:putative ABC transport system substrate-binding protein